MLGEIIFKTLTRIGRGDAPPRYGNGCKAFVAEISRTCLAEFGDLRLITIDELFARNGVGREAAHFDICGDAGGIEIFILGGVARGRYHGSGLPGDSHRRDKGHFLKHP